MPDAESKYKRSPSAMWPSSGVTIPAIARRQVVFPEPEGPKMIVTPSGALNSRSRVNDRFFSSGNSCVTPPNRFLIKTCNIQVRSDYETDEINETNENIDIFRLFRLLRNLSLFSNNHNLSSFNERVN